MSADHTPADPDPLEALYARGVTDDKGQLARHRHVERLRRGQRGVAAAIGDRIDQRSFRGAIRAENITGEILNLRPFAG